MVDRSFLGTETVQRAPALRSRVSASANRARGAATGCTLGPAAERFAHLRLRPALALVSVTVSADSAAEGVASDLGQGESARWKAPVLRLAALASASSRLDVPPPDHQTSLGSFADGACPPLCPRGVRDAVPKRGERRSRAPAANSAAAPVSSAAPRRRRPNQREALGGLTLPPAAGLGLGKEAKRPRAAPAAALGKS
jgi:hypothetical protein